jgi:hypothetical protein
MARNGTHLRRVFGAAGFAALLTASMLAPAAYATVQNSYTSTLNIQKSYWGAARVYNGTQMHIELITSASGNGTYTISVYRQGCLGLCNTIIGSAGNCPYIGFCGYVWNINLNGNERYGFWFGKTSDGVWVSSNNVHMWSTS